MVDLNINIGSVSTKGYDLNVTYSGLEMGRFGSLNFNLTGTLVDELITEPGPGIDPFDCVGFYSQNCAALGRRADTRVASPVPHELGDPVGPRPVADLALHDQGRRLRGRRPGARIDYELPAQDYFDIAANWAVTEKASVALGINNVLDDNPPISATVGTTGNGNTYPQTYDALGRYVFLRATVDF